MCEYACMQEGSRVCVCVHTAEVSGEGPSAGDKEVSVQ